MDYAKLIELVKARPGIFDKTDKMHANRGYMERSWTEIGEGLNITAATKTVVQNPALRWSARGRVTCVRVLFSPGLSQHMCRAFHSPPKRRIRNEIIIE